MTAILREREKIVFVRSDILFQQPLLPFGRSAPSIRPNTSEVMTTDISLPSNNKMYNYKISRKNQAGIMMTL